MHLSLKTTRLFRLALFFLFLTALLGTFLRYFLLDPLAWATYKYWLHAHSHIAFLGWVYNGLYALILHYFIPNNRQKRLIKLFWITQLATLGMLVFFPIQGYALESIIFSTLHIFLSWAFAFLVWKRMQAANLLAAHFLKWALFFMVISSLGPFALGPLMAQGLGGSTWYYLAIYFYLHFQYNAWFLFALFALLYQQQAKKGHLPALNSGKKALYLLVIGSLLSYSLSALWAFPEGWLYAVAALAGLFQLLGCWYLYRSFKAPLHAFFRSYPGLQPLLIGFALVAFLLKNVLQLISAIPLDVISDMAFFQRNTIIAFLHLIFLGVVTPGLLAFGLQEGWIPAGKQSKGWLLLFLIVFVLSELMLTGLPYSAFLAAHLAEILFTLSACMLLAFGGINYLAWKKRTA